MCDGKSIFLFFFVGIDKSGIFNSILCSVYDSKIIDGTITQFHWAGRNSRGATQFQGSVLDDILNQTNFITNIDYDKAKDFVDKLIDQ